MDTLVTRQNDEMPAVPHRDYTLNLLQYGALHGILTEARQTELRGAFQSAAAERAASYTNGRSTTVTKQQAEHFFSSVFCQADAALLALHSDELAMEALRTHPIDKLMDAGLRRILELFNEAKEDFRLAYRLTAPVQTSFFRDLLKGFSLFATEYDARYRAKDALRYVDFCYPLMSGQMPEEDGIFAVHDYYRALKYEGAFLHQFSADAIRGLMQQYAAKFLTSADMIAENIAELVFRHWITGILTGCGDETLLLPEDAADRLSAQFAGRPPSDLLHAMQQALRTHPLMQDAEMQQYLLDCAVPAAEAMSNKIADHNLQGWFA